MDGFVTNFTDWLKSPYSEDMSAFRWFLFLGLLIVLTVIWKLILSHVPSE